MCNLVVNNHRNTRFERLNSSLSSQLITQPCAVDEALHSWVSDVESSAVGMSIVVMLMM